VADPVETVRAQGGVPHPAIALPHQLWPGAQEFGGLDLSNESRLQQLGELFAPWPSTSGRRPR
jgi:RHH-type proline utilization regulon transcriptional repressor/proline dehydrogenase/delta 1-pyrroline-5-carboxylate dehydrogenase